MIKMDENYAHGSANFIVDKKNEFDFIIPKMKLSRNDDVKIRERF